jgi:two-component system chemotaxis response regulator CheB
MYGGVHNSSGPVNAGDIEIVVIAASLGGFKALLHLLSELPSDFPVPIIAVQHLSYHSLLVELLQQRIRHLRIKWAEDGEEPRAGTVYVGVPNHHVIVNSDGRISLLQSERINFVRPAADLLFASVAEHFGERAIGIVLTGRLHDGAAGAVHIKRAGGWVFVQDAISSECFEMPRSAIQTGAVDYVLSIRMLTKALVALTMMPGATELFRVPSGAARAASRA